MSGTLTGGPGPGAAEGGTFPAIDPIPRHRSHRTCSSAVLVAAATIATVVALPAVASAAAASAAATATGTGRVGPPVLGCSVAAVRTEVTSSARLDARCRYTGGFVIDRSGVTLDCQGATIQGSGTGNGIDVQAPTTTPLHDVHIRNCDVRGFSNGIQITRLRFLTLAAGVEYDHGFSDISVEQSRLTANVNVGIYVDGYVTGVTIRGDELRDNGSTGAYLDTGSRDNVVEANDISGNGFVASGPGGTDTDFAGLHLRYWGPGREGLAIDGSRSNRIVGNRFSDNSAGSIFLYKNCGEYYLSHADSWLPRRYGSDGNDIEGNVFVGGTHGVWVASRMGENTYPMECSAPAYVEGPLERVVEDEATDNVVRRNLFLGVTYGVHVEDDRTTVDGNLFVGSSASQYAVIIGTRLRTRVLGHPVTGTTVVGNTAWIVGSPDPYRWVNGMAGTTARANTASWRLSPFCQAPELPHNPMIMVLALAVVPPGGPTPPPPPGLHEATLGPQPPCS